MSLTEQFSDGRQLFEKDLVDVCCFFQDSMTDYNVSIPDMTILTKWLTELKEKTHITNEKIESIMVECLEKDWKLVLSVDNHIDSFKDIDTQRTLLESMIFDLKTSSQLSSNHLSADLVDRINKHILYDECKIQAAIQELTAELNLFDTAMSWIDAFKERARVAFYTYVLCSNPNKTQKVVRDVFSILHKHNADRYIDKIQPILATFDIHVDVEDIGSANLIELLYTKIQREEFIQMFQDNEDALDTLVDSREVSRIFNITIIVHSFMDDYLDIVEDLDQSKITSVIQGMKQGASPKMILSTLIEYLGTVLSSNEHIRIFQQWQIELLKLLFTDVDQFIDFVKTTDLSISEQIFQRK